jgi:hypothetical protein
MASGADGLPAGCLLEIDRQYEPIDADIQAKIRPYRHPS